MAHVQDINKPKPIPMAIVTGYLGTGKTTFVSRILARDLSLRIAVLVNDVGSVNIDQRLISKSNTDVIELSNGCTCRSINGDLVRAIKQVVDADNPPDCIVFEANGVSDPAGVILKINRSVLRNQVAIDSVIAVVDAQNYHSTRTPNDLLRKQVQLADVVLINKADLVEVDELNAATDWVESITDGANILHSVYSDVPIESLLNSGTFNPQFAIDMGGHAVHAHPVKEIPFRKHNTQSLVFATFCWGNDQPLSLTVLRNVINDLSVDIFRVKGVLYLRDYPNHRVSLQIIGKDVEIRREGLWGDNEKRQTDIMFLGHKGQVDEIELQAAMLDTLEKPIPARDLPSFNDSDLIVWQRQ